jgi:hypothetical protein
MHRALPGRKALPSETKERGSVPGWSGQCLIVCGNQEPNNPYSGVDRGRVVQACPSPVFVKATHPAPGGNGVAGLMNGRLPNRPRPIGTGLNHMLICTPQTHWLLPWRFEHRFSRTLPIPAGGLQSPENGMRPLRHSRKRSAGVCHCLALGRTSGTRGCGGACVVWWCVSSTSHEATAFLGRCATSTGNADLPLGMTHKPPTKPRNAPPPRPPSLVTPPTTPCPVELVTGLFCGSERGPLRIPGFSLSSGDTTHTHTHTSAHGWRGRPALVGAVPPNAPIGS